MQVSDPIGNDTQKGSWLDDPAHRDWLRREAFRQLDFFRASLRPDGGFDALDAAGRAMPGVAQELHVTTRLVHSYALGKALGADGCDAIIDAGMEALWRRHRDPVHGGYVWAVRGDAIADGTKLAYGHVFVLLAAASARHAGHPDADRLLADASEILERHFWEESRGLFCDEFRRDWTEFSSYRGMNANMHGVEALLAAHEVTGEGIYRDRAGRILDFFTGRMAPEHGWRIPEHYTKDWQADAAYAGNPMFRPAGTTPGHSFEFARLALQHWDLCGRSGGSAPERARNLVARAHADGWDEAAGGGYVYTLGADGAPAIRSRYWWPVTEAIGAVSALLKVDGRAEDEALYRRLWHFADAHFIDETRGGWFPEIDAAGRPAATQFAGKPDIYHALQATLLPLVPGLSRLPDELEALAR
ncbi:AGE family epimerase/isomerase [Rhodobacteraceae bacterium DSL-40]|uniref:AGE family epimerase/isomerase n=1 Tax=Amaricoccus sp. B4 TaxID=3368557 RepID=UPI000DAD61BA